MTINLPASPDPGEIVYISPNDIDPSYPDDVDIKFIWQGNGVDNTTDYWKSVGNYSYGNYYDDIFVNKNGDRMEPGDPTLPDNRTDPSTKDGSLYNLDYDPFGISSPPYGPQGGPGNYVNLEAFAEGAFNTGSYGVEYMPYLPPSDNALVIRNDGIIQGGIEVGKRLNVILVPSTEYGDVTVDTTYSYQWKKIEWKQDFVPDFDDYYGTGNPVTVVTKLAPYKRGTGYSVGDLINTTSSGNGSGCIVKIDAVDDHGEVIECSPNPGGTDYVPSEMLFPLPGEGNALFMVTDTVTLNSFEQPPDDSNWISKGEDIGADESSYLITAADVGCYIRCEITCTRGTSAVSNTNQIGITIDKYKK